MFSAELATTTK